MAIKLLGGSDCTLEVTWQNQSNQVVHSIPFKIQAAKQQRKCYKKMMTCQEHLVVLRDLKEYFMDNGYYISILCNSYGWGRSESNLLPLLNQH